MSVAVAGVLYSIVGVGEGDNRTTAMDEYLRVEIHEMYLKKAPPTSSGLSGSVSDRMNFTFGYENVSGVDSASSQGQLPSSTDPVAPSNR